MEGGLQRGADVAGVGRPLQDFRKARQCGYGTGREEGVGGPGKEAIKHEDAGVGRQRTGLDGF